MMPILVGALFRMRHEGFLVGSGSGMEASQVWGAAESVAAPGTVTVAGTAAGLGSGVATGGFAGTLSLGAGGTFGRLGLGVGAGGSGSLVGSVMPAARSESMAGRVRRSR